MAALRIFPHLSAVHACTHLQNLQIFYAHPESKPSELQDKMVQRLADDECDACVAVFASWTDVSLDLAASNYLNNIFTDAMRIFVVVFCILANLIMIVAN